MREGIEATEDAGVKASLETEYAKTAKLLERQNEAYNKFCDDNKLKRLAERIEVAKWTRSDAKKSMMAVRENPPQKTLANSARYGIMRTAGGIMQTGGKETETGGKQYPLPEYATDRDIQAAEAYRKISRVNDTEIIARNSGFPVEDIVTIKRHVFFEKHKTYDGYKLLQPDYDMAVAWNRLRAGHPEERDILLLRHELLESQIEQQRNCSLSEAHAEAKKQFDWEAALIESVGEEGEPDGLL